MSGSDEELRIRLEELTLALAASEARFHNVVMGSADGIIIIDDSGHIRFANPAAAALFNRTAENLQGEIFGFPIVAGETMELDIFRNGGGGIVEVRVSDSEWDGRPASLLTMRDITERRRAENELRKMYRAVLDSPNMVIITDPHGAIEFVNPRFTEVTGYTLPEVEGKNPGFLKSDKVPPEVYGEMQEAIRTRNVWRGELASTRKNGEIFWESVAIAPVRDLDENITNFIAISQDITDQKESDEKLSRSEKKFAALFGATPALLTVSTLEDGRFIEVNETTLQTLGYQREEIIGRSSLDLGIWANLADRENIVLTLLEKGRVRNRECLIRGKTGETFVGSISAEIIEIDNEHYMLTMVKDITERKRAEEKIEKLHTDLSARAAELEAANQELEAFNYSVAHDLRSPLNAINGYCQVVQELCSARLDEQCKEYIAEMYNGTLRMNRLIDALLNFSRLSHAEPHRELLDLCTLAREIVMTLKMTEPERLVDFLIAERMAAYADANLLRVVLNNLLGNAWKFTGMRTEAVIEFGATEDDGKPVYYVRDNGAGFGKEDADKLFIPFQRLHGPEQFKGFGIGLATVERIIRRHGGRIWAEGEPDKGACFYFTLAPDGVST
jgi:PAS domain S-box-containing protein